jgi:photosystem II stability/assembly factor-like uncharacterized protein
MRKPLLAFALLAAILCSCDGTLWGPRANPADPGAGNNPGYTFVHSSGEISAASPADGDVMYDGILVMSAVVGATAYHLKIASSIEALDSSPIYNDPACGSNTIDIAGAALSGSSRYYWKGRAKRGEAWDVDWSPVASFTTNSTWPWAKRLPVDFYESISALASSRDGARLTAIGSNSLVYSSRDGGATWDCSYNGLPFGQGYGTIASSSDGRRLATFASAFQEIFTSSDGGASWIERPGSYGVSCSALASSMDGDRLFATSYNRIFSSMDYGATWSGGFFEGLDQGWMAVASSPDCRRLAIAGNQGAILVSEDGGASWASRGPDTASAWQWSSIASSADGSRLAAAALCSGTNTTGGIWTSSDSGASWTLRAAAGSRRWAKIVSSADGRRLAALASGANILLSSDYGEHWVEQTSTGSQQWRTIASSADGVRLVATSSDGIWTGTAP